MADDDETTFNRVIEIEIRNLMATYEARQYGDHAEVKAAYMLATVAFDRQVVIKALQRFLAGKVDGQPEEMKGRSNRTVLLEQQRLRRTVEYVVLNAETDQIVSGGACQFRDLAAQATEPHHIVLEGKFDLMAIRAGLTARATETGISLEAAPPRAVRVEEVTACCRRRIFARYPIHSQINAPHEGYETEMREWIAAMRAACRALIAKSPIPLDFDDDRHWPPSA